MTEKTAAETKLAELEKTRRLMDDANSAFHRAASTGDKDLIAAAQNNLEQAQENHRNSGVTDRQIDIATQAVLDERGEKHTETNLVPPGVSSEDHHGEAAK